MKCSNEKPFVGLVSRQDSNESPALAGLLCFWGLGRLPRFKPDRFRIISSGLRLGQVQ
jgi:hypothetical protein